MKKIFPLFLIIFSVLGFWLGSLFIVTSIFDSWEIRGQFGDLFGAVNALFSGLAFAGLIYTIFLQRSELELQRQELKLQREEMAKSREELAEQADMQRAQVMSSIAQLRAIASQTRVEAIKIDSFELVAHARKNFANKIRNEATQLEELALKLEHDVNSD